MSVKHYILKGYDTMYKKIIAAVLCTAVLAGFAPAVNADVIWQPSAEDKFFYKHQSEISHEEWRAYKITEDTDIYDDPDGKVVRDVKSGEEQGVEYKYTDKNGVLWGGFADEENFGNMLWIKLDGLELVYDNISFTEEHSDEIYPYDNSFSVLDSDAPITFYDYPDSEDFFTAENHPENWTAYISLLYNDGKQVWGYVRYMWGMKGWIKLDDTPAAEVTQQDTTVHTSTEDPYTTATGERDVLAHPEQETTAQTEQITTEESEQDTTTMQETTTALEQDTSAASEKISESEVTTESRPVDKPVKTENSFLLAGILAAAAAGVSAVLLIIFGKKKK